MREASDRSLGLLVLAALAARALAATASPLVNADAYVYLDTAGLWRAGDWAEALSRWNLHPLYPILAGLAGGGWSGAAAVSVVAGALALLPLWTLAKEGWGRDTALFAGLVYALHPVVGALHGKVLTEGVYHLAALSAVLAAVRLLRGGGWGWAVGGGLALGAAYLARAEGLILAALLATACTGAVVVYRDARPAAARLALMAAVALAVASPYAVWLGGLTPRGASLADAAEAPRLAPPLLFLRELSRIVWTPLLVLCLPGLIAFRRGSGGGRVGAFLALVAGGYLAAVLLNTIRSGGYLSERYLSTAVLLLLPWAGRGLERAAAWMPSRWATAFVLLCAVVLSARTLDVRRMDDLHVLEAALWLRDHGGRGRLVLTSHDAVAVHAEARYFAERDPKKIAEAVREGRIDYLVFRERDLGVLDPEVREPLRERPPLARFGEPGRGTVVYALR